MTHMTTISGACVDLTRPDPSLIRPYDICHSLAFINRYNGHTTEPYSVGQHTLAMVRHAEEKTLSDPTIREILIHDFAEYVLCDIPAPLKPLLGSRYEMLTTAWDNAIRERFNCPRIDMRDKIVSEIDLMARDTEVALLTNISGTDIPNEGMTNAVGWVLNFTPSAVIHELNQMIEKYLTKGG